MTLNDRIRRHGRYRMWVPYFVLVLCVAATGAAAVYVRITSEKQDLARFNGAVERTRIAIANRTETYSATLHNITALLRTGGIPNREQFHEYVGRLDVHQRYPGILGIGLSMRVPAGERDSFEKVGRENIVPSFRIWPQGPPDAECHAIFYLEPADEPNQEAIGYDMHSEPIRAAAMDAAMDSGSPTASGRVELVQDADKPGTSGFLIYMPLYKFKQIPESIEDRRARLYGYIYAPFRADDLLRGVFLNDPAATVDFRLYDGAAVDPSALMHDSSTFRPSGNGGVDDEPRYARLETIEVAGRPWTIRFATRPEFDHASSRWLTPSIWVLGGLVSLTFFVVTRSQVTALVEGRRAKEAAEAANQAKDRFLAVLSHELRTPLAPILASASQSRDDPSLSPEVRDDMRMIARNVQLEARLIDDLLDLTRIAQGKIRLHPEAVDAHAALRNVVSMFQADADAKRLGITTELGATECHVWADAARLQQVFLNLLSNAIKFTPEGGTIVVRSANVDGKLRIGLEDSGVGVDAEVLPRLFNAFEQGEQTVTRRFGGLGLGLSISRSLVEMHGGTIHASSNGTDRGATFTVELKTVTPPPRPIAPEVPALQGAVPARILLVEDHADTRRVLVKLLSAFGYAVTPAGSVKEALEAAGREKFDLLVSDIGLPDGSGTDVMRHVREQYNMKGIAVSGFGQEEDLRRSRDAGFETHITKPINFQALHDVIQKVAS